MGLFLTLSKIYVPRFLRKRKLELLFDATADAFRVPIPSTRGLSFNNCLVLYAQFTRDLAAKSIQQNNRFEIESRLFKNAYRIGRQFKTDFHINNLDEAMVMSRVIYKLLKIEFCGKSDGNIIIERCFFSSYYSNDICQLISFLDEGLITGLSGGGKLTFSKRLTSGDRCCHAHVEPAGKVK